MAQQRLLQRLRGLQQQRRVAVFDADQHALALAVVQVILKRIGRCAAFAWLRLPVWHDAVTLWEDAATCLSVIKDWGDFNVYFLETPLWSDNVHEMAKLVEKAPMPIAFGEWLATRFEFEELLDIGKVQVAQPDVGTQTPNPKPQTPNPKPQTPVFL